MGKNSKAVADFCIKWLRRLLAMAYYLAFFACAGKVGSAAGNPDGVPASAIFIFGAVLVFFAWNLIILIHELGHAIAGWAVGWRVMMVSVRGLTIWPEKKRVRLGAFAFPELNGGVVVAPRRQQGLREQFVSILVAGAGANFLLALCAACLAFYFRERTFLATYLEITAFLSVQTGVVNLVPRIWGTNNDGFMIVETLRSESFEPQAMEMMVGVEIVEGRRPRDWSSSMVQGLENNLATEQGTAHSGLLLFSRYFDQRNMSSARSALDWAEHKLGSSNIRVRLCRALLLAYADGDGAAATEILSAIKVKRIRDSPQYRIAQAVAAWASGDRVGQEEAVRMAQVALDRAPFQSVSNLELLKEIEVPRATSAEIGAEVMSN